MKRLIKFNASFKIVFQNVIWAEILFIENIYNLEPLFYENL